jgi:hypothetical protein
VRSHITSPIALEPPTITTGGSPIARQPATIATTAKATAAATLRLRSLMRRPPADRIAVRQRIGR